jgi:hypothetical protein
MIYFQPDPTVQDRAPAYDRRAWTDADCDPSSEFGKLYALLRNAALLAGRIQDVPVDDNTREDAARLLRYWSDVVRAKFESWQPTECCRAKPH